MLKGFLWACSSHIFGPEGVGKETTAISFAGLCYVRSVEGMPVVPAETAANFAVAAIRFYLVNCRLIC